MSIYKIKQFQEKIGLDIVRKLQFIFEKDRIWHRWFSGRKLLLFLLEK